MEITHQDVTKPVLKGVLMRGGSIGQWLVEYGRHMKKIAAGWQSADCGLDLIAEKARLAAIQADNIAPDVARKRNEVIPQVGSEKFGANRTMNKIQRLFDGVALSIAGGRRDGDAIQHSRCPC